jgi:hypothetical protein
MVSLGSGGKLLDGGTGEGTKGRRKILKSKVESDGKFSGSLSAFQGVFAIGGSDNRAMNVQKWLLHLLAAAG